MSITTFTRSLTKTQNKSKLTNLKDKLSILVIALVVSIAGMTAMVPAANATPGTNDYPYRDATDWCGGFNQDGKCIADQDVDQWGFYVKECVSFVAWRMNNDNQFVNFKNDMSGPDGPGHLGSAVNWGTVADNMGYLVDDNPAPGSVAWWSSGHVAWVRAVNGDSVDIEEYNYADPDYHKYGQRTINKANASGYIHFKDLSGNPPPPPVNTEDNKVVDMVKTTYGSAQQVFTATKTKVYESWWAPGSGNPVQTNVVAQNLPGLVEDEVIVDIDKLTLPNGVQSLYIATNHSVYEVWWNGGGYSSPAEIIYDRADIREIAADYVTEASGALLHRVYVLDQDGPYTYSWRDDGQGVSSGYLLWNIPNAHSLVKSKSLDGKDEVYVADSGRVYRIKWFVNGVYEKKYVSTLADTIGIAKHAVGTTEYLYTATRTGVHETWWKTGGFSAPTKIVTAPANYQVVDIDKTLNGSYQQLSVAYVGTNTSRTIEYSWGGGLNGIQIKDLETFNNKNIVGIAKSTSGTSQYLYTALDTSVYETWWGTGLALDTGTIENFAD